MLAIAITAHSCAAFAPSPALGPLRRLSPSSALRTPVSGLRVARASLLDRVGSRLRNSNTAAISKIFPAGAGWQAASLVAAEKLGLASTSFAFFGAVGLGEFLGVFLGHTLFFLMKKLVRRDPKIKMGEQLQVATLLGGSAFCSGATRQPALNALRFLGLDFTGVFLGVGVSCTLAFFTGMRVWRKLLSPSMDAIEPNSYQNQKSDVQLAIAIGVNPTACNSKWDTSFIHRAICPRLQASVTLGALRGRFDLACARSNYM